MKWYFLSVEESIGQSIFKFSGDHQMKTTEAVTTFVATAFIQGGYALAFGFNGRFK